MLTPTPHLQLGWLGCNPTGSLCLPLQNVGSREIQLESAALVSWRPRRRDTHNGNYKACLWSPERSLGSFHRPWKVRRSEEDIASCLEDKKNLNGRNKLQLNHGNRVHCEQTETGDAGTLKKRGGNMRKQGMYGTQGRYQAIGAANRGGMGKTGWPIFFCVVQRKKPVNVFIDEMETEKELYCDGLTESGNTLRAHPET